jgi:hypothetical protein
MKSLSVAVAVATLAVASAGVQAGVIDDADFFSSISHTLITFNTYANGDPVVLGQGEWCTMYYDEYIDSGVWFDYEPYDYPTNLSYVNDADANFDIAQGIGGSLQIAFPSDAEDSFAMVFDDPNKPVRAFGFWVVNNNTEPNGVTFTAKNASGDVLGTVSLEGSLIDGTLGSADYGFMGLYADEDIARVEITKEYALLDDLRFSEEVPEPVTVGLLALGGLAVLRRRARR